MKRINFTDLITTPWKNGGGTTRELSCHPPGASLDNFLWRASIADVRESGRFSTFPGIDRIIALLDGDGMTLEFENGQVHALTAPCAPFRFRGEASVHARLAGSASRDLNLMLRRGLVEGAMEVRRTGGTLACANDSLLLFCAQGSWSVQAGDQRHSLDLHQTLAGEASGAPLELAALQPDSILLCMRMHATQSRSNP